MRWALKYTLKGVMICSKLWHEVVGVIVGTSKPTLLFATCSRHWSRRALYNGKLTSNAQAAVVRKDRVT